MSRRRQEKRAWPRPAGGTVPFVTAREARITLHLQPRLLQMFSSLSSPLPLAPILRQIRLRLRHSSMRITLGGPELMNPWCLHQKYFMYSIRARLSSSLSWWP